MKRSAATRKGQGGTVLILTAFAALALFAFMGLALDLGRGYTVKTELQNAADAGALAGARELNQTAGGVALAFDKAKEYAAKNQFDFSSTDVVVPDANIQFGPGPDGPWFDKAYAEANPSGLTFVKVDTGARTLNTLFMRVASAEGATLGTFGSAVAGRYVVQVTPLGVCAIDPDTKGGVRPGTGELTEFGFRRGIAYNIPSLNPLGAPRDPIWINPVAYEGGPTPCQGSQGSSNFMAPFVCQGNSAIVPATGGRVYVNTGKQVVMERALNSRFALPLAGVNPSPCAAGTAPPDGNIQYYSAGLPPSGNPKPVDPSGDGYPREWMEEGGSAYPNAQTIQLKAGTIQPVDYPNLNPPAEQYGVLWSFNRAVRAAGAAPNATAGAAFDLSNATWAQLYNAGVAAFPSGNPLFEAAAYGTKAPYEQTSGNYFRPYAGGVKHRRVLNVAILDCRGYIGGGMCASSLPVVGVGKFFMQVPADLNPGGGVDPHIETEFAGLLDPAPKSDIKLYR